MCVLCQASGHPRIDHIGANTEATGSGTAQLGSASLAQAIDNLQTSWTHEADPSPIKWSGGTIRYDILSGPVSGGAEGAGFQALSAIKAGVAQTAFELWDDLIAVDIAEGQGAALTIAESATTAGGGTYASYSFYYDGIRNGVDRFKDVGIWLNSGWSTHNEDADMTTGSYGSLTYLHEIGHALGLSHPGTYNADQAGPINYANSAEFAEDTRQFTVMSYFNAGSGGGADHRGADGQIVFAQTPMLLDIAAIQDLYGADMTTRTGDTTYGFNVSGLAGHEAVYDFTRNDEPVLTLWDAGGIDTLDVSGFADNTVIDLNAGAWSSVGGMRENIAIAHGATIENARGGSGSETIIGNAAGNRLFGGAGADDLRGADGNDTLFGGNDAASDTLNGGTGDDALYGGAGADTLQGEAGNDVLGGGLGSDAIWGGRGHDTIFGGGAPGDDHLDGGAGNDVVWGGGGTDGLYGWQGDDLLGTGSGDDRAVGGEGADTLYGGAGNDTLEAGTGADLVYGGAGNDIIDLGTNDGAADTFVFQQGHGHDTVTGFETGIDTIDLSAMSMAKADILANITDTPTGINITLADNASITIEGITRDAMTDGLLV